MLKQKTSNAASARNAESKGKVKELFAHKLNGLSDEVRALLMKFTL